MLRPTRRLERAIVSVCSGTPREEEERVVGDVKGDCEFRPGKQDRIKIRFEQHVQEANERRETQGNHKVTGGIPTKRRGTNLRGAWPTRKFE